MVHIIIHILPQEIDQLEILMVNLKRSSMYLSKNDFHVEVQLNLNLTDWFNSSIPKMFFVDKLLDIETLTKSWASTEFAWDDRGKVLGCNDARRNAIRKTKAEWIMYLDVDNILSQTFLGVISILTKEFTYEKEKEFKIFCPETTRMWDSTWDVITNERFLKEPAGHEYYDVRDPYSILLDDSDETWGQYRGNLRYVPGFKFAGWGTTIPSKLAKIIDVPDSLGPYGLDDTFIMMGCQVMQTKGFIIHEYAIQNELVMENNLFRGNPYRDYLTNIDRRQEFLNNANKNFQPELEKLNARL